MQFNDRRSGMVTSCALALPLALAGCGGGKPASDALACFPAASRAWINREVAGSAVATSSPAESATIYVDRSGSMGGYIAGSTADERPFQDLLRVLPDKLDAEGTRISYVAFGTRLSPQPAASRDALMQSGFYACKGGDPAKCDNQESRFDLVLRAIEAKPTDLALLVSDLWFVNSKTQTSALTDLAAPLAAILKQGRAVAIYGLPAKFRGPIYDLPAAPGRIAFDGRHPLYLVAVGSDAQLDNVHERMIRAGSPYLQAGLANGTIRRTLFSSSPRVAAVGEAEPLRGSDPVVARAPVIESQPGIRIQQLEIGRGAALRARSASSGMSWTGPAPTSFRKDVVWSGPLEGRTRVWERRGERCTPADWIEARPLAGLWQPATDGQHRFRLDPRAVVTGLGRSGTYLVTGELRRTSLETPNPASAWMREWSFSARQSPAGRVDRGEPIFPTLNLSEVARLLEDALAEAAARQPKPIDGFNVIVRVAD